MSGNQASNDACSFERRRQLQQLHSEQLLADAKRRERTVADSVHVKPVDNANNQLIASRPSVRHKLITFAKKTLGLG